MKTNEKKLKQRAHALLRMPLIIGIPLIVASCTERNLPKSIPPKVETSIEQKASGIFSSLFPNNTRTEAMTSLDSLETSDSDTKLYLANFANGGFLLFRDGCDEEMNVLAFSDQSSLKFSDAETNPILNDIFLACTTKKIDMGKIDPDDPTTQYPLSVVERRSAYSYDIFFRPNTYEYLSQRAPFNAQIKDQHPAGCGPIAVVTLLSHYEMQAGGSRVDWRKLKENYNKPGMIPDLSTNEAYILYELQKLVADAWRYELIISTDGYTMTFPYHITGYLKRAGLNATYRNGYDATEMCNTLKEKHQPFILLGWAKDDDSKKKAHYWVVDGFAHMVHTEYGYTINHPGAPKKPFERKIIDSNLIHCTWGWGGSYNGWFNPYLINENNGVEIRSSNPSGEYHNISTFYIWK